MRFSELTYDRPSHLVRDVLALPKFIELFENWEEKPVFHTTVDIDYEEFCFVTAVHSYQDKASYALDMAEAFLEGYFSR